MKSKWKTLRMGAMLFALPVVATAAASAHQWMTDSTPLTIDSALLSVKSELINAQRNHVIALNDSGAVEGRIATIGADASANGLSDMKVFLSQAGEIKYSTTTDEGGLFTLDNAAEGSYSFIAVGEDGFVAYSVRVVENQGANDVSLMEATAVSPKSKVVQDILKAQLPANVADQVIADSTSAKPVAVLGANRVIVRDGVLTGNVSSLASLEGGSTSLFGTQIIILKDGNKVAESVSGDDGSFSFTGIAPGVYDFVANGPAGFAAVGFEAVEEAATDEIPVSLSPILFQEPGFPIQQQGNACCIPRLAQLQVPLAETRDIRIVDERVIGENVIGETVGQTRLPIQFAGEQVSLGGAVGGQFGTVVGTPVSGAPIVGTSTPLGGGILRGGLGGGLGRGARLGLLGAAIAIPVAVAAGDGDDVTFTPPPATPATP